MKKLFIILSALILSAVSPLYASYCTHCGKNLQKSANFCSNCGHAVYKGNSVNSCSNTNGCNNGNITTTRTNVVYNDGISSTSTVRTLSTYVPNTETQIIYKNEYYYPTPVTRTVVVREPVCDPLFGLMVWGIIHGSHHHHHHHHRYYAPAPVRHLPPPPPSRRGPHPGARRAHFKR
jgi:hypothetical protein